jgi:hypothetical protein
MLRRRRLIIIVDMGRYVAPEPVPLRLRVSAVSQCTLVAKLSACGTI